MSTTEFRVVKRLDQSDIDTVSVSLDDIVVKVDEITSENERPGWIKVVNRSLGKNNGNVGWIPEHCLVPNEIPNYLTDHNPAIEPVLEYQEVNVTSPQSHPDEQGLLPSGSPNQTIQPFDSKNEIKPGTRVIARYEYFAEKADEIDLHVDDVIVVLSSPMGGWWRGMIGYGKTTKAGWFPSTLVEIMEEQTENTSISNESYASLNSTTNEANKSLKKRTSWYQKFVGKSKEKRSRSQSLDSKLLRKKKRAANHKRSTSADSYPNNAAQKESWRSRLDEQQLNQMTSCERKRQDIIWELYATEKDYVRDLNIIINNFVKPLSEKKLLNSKQSDTLFKNINSIIEVNTEFSNILRRKWEANTAVQAVGDAFLDMSGKFLCYIDYCADCQNALSKVQAFSNSNKGFRNHLKEVYETDILRGLDLESFLIKPAQRICKYPLLIRELLKCTQLSHVDRDNLEDAYLRINDLVSIVNRGSEYSVMVKKMKEIQSSFSDKVSIVQPCRYLIREDAVYVLLMSESKQPRRLFLFNDIVVIAKKDWKDKNQVVFMDKCENISVFTVEGDPANLFHLQTKAPNSTNSDLNIFMNTANSRHTWMEAFNKVSSIKASLKELKPPDSGELPSGAEFDKIFESDDSDLENGLEINPEEEEEGECFDNDIRLDNTPSIDSRSVNSGEERISVDSIGSKEQTVDELDDLNSLKVRQPVNIEHSGSFSAMNSPRIGKKPLGLALLERKPSISLGLKNPNNNISVPDISQTPARTKSMMFNPSSVLESSSNLRDNTANMENSASEMTISALRSKIQDQEKQVGLQQSEIIKLNNRISELERKNDELLTLTSSQTEKVMNLTAENASALKAISILKSDFTEKELSHRNEIQTLMKQLEQQKKDFEFTVRQNEQEKSMLKSKFERELAETKKAQDIDILRANREMDATIKTYEQQIKDLKSANQRKDEVIMRLETENAHKGNLFSSQSDGHLESTDFSALMTIQRLEVFANSIDKSKQELAEVFRAQIDALKKDHEETLLGFKKTLMAQESALRDKENVLFQKEGELSGSRRAHSEQQATLTSLMETIDLLRKEIGEKNELMTHKEEDIIENERNVMKWKAAFEQELTRRQANDVQLEKYRENLDSQKEQNRELKEIISRMDNESLQHQTALHNAMSELKTATSTCTNLQNLLTLSQAEIQKLKQIENELTIMKSVNKDQESELDRLFKVEEAYESLKERFNELSKAHNELEIMFQNLKNQEENESAKLLQDEKLIAESRQEMEILLGKISELEAAIKSKSSEVDSSAQMLKMTQDTVCNLENHRSELEKEVAQYKAKMKAAMLLKKRFKKLESDHTQLIEAQKKLKQSEVETINKLAETESSLQNSLRRITDFQNQTVKLKNECTINKHEIIRKGKENASLLLIINNIYQILSDEPIAENVSHESVIDLVHHMRLRKDQVEDEVEILKLQIKDLEKIQNQLEKDLLSSFDALKMLEKRAVDQKDRFEGLIETYTNENQALMSQVKSLIVVDAQDEQSWLEKYEQCRAKTVEVQKLLISEQAKYSELQDVLEEKEMIIASLKHELDNKNSILNRYSNVDVKQLNMATHELKRLQAQNLLMRKRLQTHIETTDQSYKSFVKSENSIIEQLFHEMYDAINSALAYNPFESTAAMSLYSLELATKLDSIFAQYKQKYDKLFTKEINQYAEQISRIKEQIQIASNELTQAREAIRDLRTHNQHLSEEVLKFKSKNIKE